MIINNMIIIMKQQNNRVYMWEDGVCCNMGWWRGENNLTQLDLNSCSPPPVYRTISPHPLNDFYYKIKRSRKDLQFPCDILREIPTSNSPSQKNH